MVDEDQNVWTIDFPQMVSTSHPDADFYFERDQTCIHTLFKRKFGKTFDRRYTLASIDSVKRLDIEVKASGFDKSISTDDALEGYLCQARLADHGMEGEATDQDDIDMIDDMQVDDAIDNIDDMSMHDDDIGDIEVEMMAIHGVNDDVKIDGEGKVEGKLDGKDGEAKDEDKGDEEGEEEDEDEEQEVDWEAKQEKRRQMKALKKEKLANKPVKSMMVKIEKADKVKEDGDESESEEDEQENELIKRAIKKKYRKKKVIKGNKNHPKQFNAAVRDQMEGFK